MTLRLRDLRLARSSEPGILVCVCVWCCLHGVSPVDDGVEKRFGVRSARAKRVVYHAGFRDAVRLNKEGRGQAVHRSGGAEGRGHLLICQ